MDDHKLFFRKSKTKLHRILLKRICSTTESYWNLLIDIQEHLFYWLHTKNSNCYGYRYETKYIYFAALSVGGKRNWKTKIFVSLTLQSYYFLMACFKTIILKNITLWLCKVHVFEVPLSICVFDYYRKIYKRKQPFTVAINKKTDILLTIPFQKMKRWI